MVLSEEKVQELLNVVIERSDESDLKARVKAVVYREDYQDYVVVLSNMCYTEIREKLISDFIEFKHDDVKRELAFKLVHAIELEEWQLEDMGLSLDEFSEEDLAGSATQEGKGSTNQMTDEEEAKRGIAVDDDDKYDWI